MTRQPEDMRFSRLRTIEGLDPIEDWLRVTQLFYKDFQNATWLKTPEDLGMSFAVPRMAEILHRTRAYERNFLKRFVEQGVLVGTMQKQGYGDGPGKDAARRMNGIHRKYPIHPDDFIVIGCIAVVGPGELAARFGWRDVSEKEKIALAHSAVLMLDRMGLRDIPRTYEQQRNHVERYLDEHAAPSEAGSALGAVMLDFFVSIEEEPLRSIMSPLLRSVLDARIVAGLGLDRPGDEVVSMMNAYMKAVGQLDPVTDDTLPVLTKVVMAQYPHGFDVRELGVHKVDADTSLRADGPSTPYEAAQVRA